MALIDGNSDGQRGLTEAEAAILRSELANDPAGRGYAGKDAPTQADLINGSWVTDNPPPATVARPALMQGDILVLTSRLQAKHAGAKLQGQALPDGLAYVIDTLLPSVSKQVSMDLTDPDVQEMMGALEQAGLLTQDEITALTTQPDPAWVAQTVHASRASELFTAPPLTITVADIEGLAQ